MNQILKQSTATTARVGPFVDATDGFTAETGLTIQKAGVRLSKEGGALAAAHADQGASNVGAPHDAVGVYAVALDATDTDTLGRLSVVISPSGARPRRADFTVVTADVYAQLVSGTEDIGEDATNSQVWYVRTTGSDANDGKTVSTAFLTVNAAAARANRGDTISVDQASMNAAGIDYSAVQAHIQVDG